jgi:predicted nucleic acid-binding protein
MAWLISDANILIDMDVGEVLDKMFSLPERFAVPDVLYMEELIERHPHLPALGLTVLSVREEYVLEAYRLGGIYKRPGHNDLLALALAKQESCPLLTGDAKLREAAELEQVEVKGTLWLMERLFVNKLLDYDEIKAVYERMQQGGRRLPMQEITSQLKWMECR